MLSSSYVHLRFDISKCLTLRFLATLIFLADIPSQGQADPSATALLFGIHQLLRESFALPRSPWRGVGFLSSQPTTGYNHSGANHVTSWSQDRCVVAIMQAVNQEPLRVCFSPLWSMVNFRSRPTALS